MHPSITMIDTVAHRLGPYAEQVVFLGGAVVPLLVTDQAAPPVRHTQDVDLVIEAASLSSYSQWDDHLRSLGFTHVPDVICRWQVEGVLVDVMPQEERILGFANHWYAEALRSAAATRLPTGLAVRVIAAPCFLATKLEAFRSRGGEDYHGSADLEDIVAVLDGRAALCEETSQAAPDLRAYVAGELAKLLRHRDFVEALPGHLGSALAGGDRLALLLRTAQQIAGLARSP